VLERAVAVAVARALGLQSERLALHPYDTVHDTGPIAVCFWNTERAFHAWVQMWHSSARRIKFGQVTLQRAIDGEMSTEEDAYALQARITTQQSAIRALKKSTPPPAADVIADEVRKLNELRGGAGCRDVCRKLRPARLQQKGLR
jgi:hypothetical protein